MALLHVKTPSMRAIVSLLLLCSAAQSAPSLPWDDERFPSFSLLAASDPPFTSCGNALCFSGSFNNNQIFQRAPAMAAVYGSIPKSTPTGATVTVTLAGTAKDGTTYSKAFPATINADYTFKALLDPMVAGGNYSFTAVCPTCPGPTAISYQGGASPSLSFPYLCLFLFLHFSLFYPTFPPSIPPSLPPF